MTEFDLDARLRALATGGGSPDWADVQRRLRRPRRRLVLVAAALLAIAVASAALAFAPRLLDLLHVTRSNEEVPRQAAVAYVSGDLLRRPGHPPLRLGGSVLAPLLGQDAALAVSSPDGRYVAYHAWTDNTPMLRVVDLATGRDRLIARGAQGIAWAGDGRIAYFQAIHPRFIRSPYYGRVVVRDGVGGKPVVWTPVAASWGVGAWAGRSLLVSTGGCYYPPCDRQPKPGVYALDGPGRIRRLSVATISAVSPDGRRVIGMWVPYPGQDSPSPVVHVDDVRTGRTIASINLVSAAHGRAPGGGLRGGLGSADWRGDTIVGVSSFGRISTLVFLRFAHRRLRLDQVLRLDRAALRGAPYGAFFMAPMFVGRGTRSVVAHVEGELPGNTGFNAILTCDRVTRRCVRGRPLPPRRWVAIVGNRSRPFR